MGSGLRETHYHLRGLTLLECLITLAIVAILMGIGVPAYRDQLASARARAGAEQLYAAMQYARSMAQARGTVVTLCPVINPSEKPPQCGGHFGQSIAAIEQNGEDSKLLHFSCSEKREKMALGCASRTFTSSLTGCRSSRRR